MIKTAKVVFFAAVEGWIMPEWVRYPTSGAEAQVFAHKYHDTLGKKIRSLILTADYKELRNKIKRFSVREHRFFF